MKKKNNKKRKSSKKYEKPIDSYLKKQIPYLEKYEFGGIGGGQMNQQIFDASSAALMATTTDAVAGMLGTIMGNSNVPKVFDYSPNQNPIMAKGGIVGDPPYKKVGNYQTSFHPKDMAYFERMQKRFPEAYEASKSQYLLPGMHEVGTESVYKDDSYNPNTKEDNIDYETKYIIKSGGRSIPRTANQQGMHNFDIKDDQIMMPRLSALDKRLYKKSLRQYAKGTGMQGVQNDPPPRKSLGKYTARVSPQDQKFYDRIQKKATPEAWQAIQGQFMTPGEYDLGMEDDIYRGYKYNPNTKEDNVTTKSKYFATSGNYEYPHTVIDDVKGLSNYNVTEDGYLDVAPLSRKGKESDIRKIRKIMRKYSKGGVVQTPVAEVEDGEVYEKPNGEVGVFVGDKHGQDTDGDGFEGIPVTEQEVPKDTKIFSAQLGMAKKKLDREKEKKKQQEDLKENPTVFERNTYKRGEEIRAMQQKADEQIQEAANMLDQGQQMANDLAIVKQKYGGLIKYANGGSTGNNMFNTLLGIGNNMFGGAVMGGTTTPPPKVSDDEIYPDETPVEPAEKEKFKMPVKEADYFYDNWKNKQPALRGVDNSNAFNTNLNLGMGDVNAGFQYNIPKSNSYIKGNLNQQLTPLFTEGRVPTPTGSLEGYYGGNTFDITGKLNTDFQNTPTGSIGVNMNPSNNLSTHANLNLGEDFGMNAGLNWNPSDKISTGLDLNVNKEGLGIEGTGEYRVNPNLTLGATGRYNTGEGFTGDANLRYTFDRNKNKKIPTAFGKGGMIPKYQHGGILPKFNNGGGLGISPYQMQQMMIGARRQNRAQDYLPTDWSVDQMLNERFGGDVTKLQQHIVDTQKANPGVFGGYSMGKFGKNRDGVDGDFGKTSRGFFDDPSRKAALAESLGYSTLGEDNPYGAQPGLYSEANMNRLIHPNSETNFSNLPDKSTITDPFKYEQFLRNEDLNIPFNKMYPDGMPQLKNPLGIQQGLNIAESSSYPDLTRAQNINQLAGKEHFRALNDWKLEDLAKDEPLSYYDYLKNSVDFDNNLVRKGGGFDPTGQKSGSNPIPFKNLSKEQQRARLIKEGKITEDSTPEQINKAINSEQESSSDTSGYNFTMGDMMGFAGTGIGGVAPMLTTLINRATDTPNINPYLNYGKAGLAELEKMKGAFGTIRDENLRDIGLKSDTQRKRARSSARSVNTLRAFEDLANAREQELTSDIYTKYAGQMARINGSIAKAMDARDSMTMQGRAKQDEADRMDRDNFFTQLNQDFGSMGEAMQKIGKDLNVKQLDKDFLDVLTSTNKYGIGYRYNQSGKFEMFSKNTGKSLTPKEQKKYLANLKKEMDEKNKAVWSANKEAKKQAKKQNLPVTNMGYQSLLLGNQTGVNTNPINLGGSNFNFQQFANLKK